MVRVRVLIAMKRAMLRHSPGGLWGWKTWVGLALALGTLAAGLDAGRDAARTGETLALLFAVWTFGWLLAPLQSGGGDETLLPEHFSLLPIPPRQLAMGLLAASFYGAGPLVTAVAFAVLVVFGGQLGIGALLIALPALVLQLLFVVLLAKVALGAAGAAMQSRLGLELVALQYALLISLSSVGWVLFAALGDGGLLDGLSGGVPSALSIAVHGLPSGWGAVAVTAMGEANWVLALGALMGLGVVDWLLLITWTAMIRRRMTTRPSGGTRRAALMSGRGRRVLPATPLGASIGRELRTWLREPRSALELRVAVLSGLFIALIPALVGFPVLVPFAGAFIAVMAGVSACNSYGLEGSALWLTILTPHAARVDVRGKQVAFLLLFAPTALLVTVVLTALTGEAWAWPWALGVVPALLGGAAGLMILVSTLGAAPVPEAARRSGNLLAGADNAGPAYVTFFAVPLAAIPAAATIWAGMAFDSAALRWAGVSVGMVTGFLLAWGLGAIAVKRLETKGPELLDLLRHGRPSKTRAAGGGGWLGELPPGLPGKVALACWSLFWLPLFPQGLAPLVVKLTGSDVKSWFLALYLPEPLQWPVIFAMIALGVGLTYAAVTIQRRDGALVTPPARSFQGR